jgi:hypothetical protein
MTKRTRLISSEDLKGRIRPALRAAIRLIVEEGHTQADAARTVGMNPVSLSLALRKPHVVALRAAVKRAWLESESSKAWVTMADLMHNGVSEDIRLKAAKVFLEQAGELGPKHDNTKPRSLVQIVVNGADARPEMRQTMPGVFEVRHEWRDEPGSYDEAPA